MIEKVNKIDIPLVYELKVKRNMDKRGSLTKIFNKSVFEDIGMDTDIKEVFFSSSAKNVLRGLHFQKPPHDYAKIVFCLSGSIQDVVVDLRKDSPTFGQHHLFELHSEDSKLIYIPSGLAHGFLSYEDNSTIVYITTGEYVKECDTGILWDSCSIDWSVKNGLIISDRDNSFQPFDRNLNVFYMPTGWSQNKDNLGGS